MGAKDELDLELVKELKAAKKKRRNFLLVMKNPENAELFLSRKRIKATRIQEMKKSSGGKIVIQGSCIGAGDVKMTFEVADSEPPATAAKAVKKIANERAGMTIKAEFKLVTEVEVIDEEGDEEVDSTESIAESTSAAAPPAEEAPAAAPADDSAARLASLGTALKQVAGKAAGVMKANPEHQKELMAAIGGVKADIVAKDPDAGTAKLSALVARLKEIAAGGAAARGDDEAAPAAPAAAADAEIDATVASAGDDAAARKTLRTALKGHGAVVKAAILARPGEQGDLMAMMAAAKEATVSASLDEARNLVGSVATYAQSIVDGADAAPAAETAAPAVRPGFVSMQRARLSWDAARKQARGDLERLEKAILTQSAGEEQAGEIAAATGRLYEVLGGRDEKILDALDHALNTPADDRALPAIKSLIRDYQSFLQSDELASQVDQNPFLPVRVRGVLTATLAEVDAALA